MNYNAKCSHKFSFYPWITTCMRMRTIGACPNQYIKYPRVICISSIMSKICDGFHINVLRENIINIIPEWCKQFCSITHRPHREYLRTLTLHCSYAIFVPNFSYTSFVHISHKMIKYCSERWINYYNKLHYGFKEKMSIYIYAPHPPPPPSPDWTTVESGASRRCNLYSISWNTTDFIT